MNKRQIATKYRQNDQYVVSYWSDKCKCWMLSSSMAFHRANEFLKSLRDSWNGHKQRYID